MKQDYKYFIKNKGICDIILQCNFYHCPIFIYCRNKTNRNDKLRISKSILQNIKLKLICNIK
jgi:hypothetical protein